MTKHCTKCGSTIDSEDIYCPECGHKMKKGKIKTHQEKKSNSKKFSNNKRILFIGILIPIILIAGFMFWQDMQTLEGYEGREYTDVTLYCGDGFCNGYETEGDVETIENCPGDCGYCGDGFCDYSSNEYGTCSEDCNTCGDGVCNVDWEENECKEDSLGLKKRVCIEDCGKCPGILYDNSEGDWFHSCRSSNSIDEWCSISGSTLYAFTNMGHSTGSFGKYISNSGEDVLKDVSVEFSCIEEDWETWITQNVGIIGYTEYITSEYFIIEIGKPAMIWITVENLVSIGDRAFNCYIHYSSKNTKEEYSENIVIKTK